MSNSLRIEKFDLESGIQLSDIPICYHTFGTLNASKDNVILVCHALTANSNVEEWWPGLMGTGKVFNPEEYFIICANNMGSPYGTVSAISINPETNDKYRLAFPFFTIRDTARLHISLMEQLGITEVSLLIGGSCGGNIALEMAYSLGNRLQNLALLCSSAKESAWTIGIHETQRMVLESDPSFKSDGEEPARQALVNCRALAMPYYRNQVNFSERQSNTELDKLTDFKASSYLRYQGKKFADRFDAHCYYTLLNALDTHNIGRGRGSIESALLGIKAPTICIGLDTDILIPPTEQKFLATQIPNAEYVEIKSKYGHDGFLIEFDQINAILLEFLKG